MAGGCGTNGNHHRVAQPVRRARRVRTHLRSDEARMRRVQTQPACFPDNARSIAHRHAQRDDSDRIIGTQAIEGAQITGAGFHRIGADDIGVIAHADSGAGRLPLGQPLGAGQRLFHQINIQRAAARAACAKAHAFARRCAVTAVQHAAVGLGRACTGHAGNIEATPAIGEEGVNRMGHEIGHAAGTDSQRLDAAVNPFEIGGRHAEDGRLISASDGAARGHADKGRRAGAHPFDGFGTETGFFDIDAGCEIFGHAGLLQANVRLGWANGRFMAGSSAQSHGWCGVPAGLRGPIGSVRHGSMRLDRAAAARFHRCVLWPD